MEGTECPDSYATLGAFSVLSILTGRKVWLPFGTFSYVPNIYVVNVGPPGNRKSTSTDVGVDLLKAIGKVNVTCSSLSARRLAENMASCATIFHHNGKAITHSPLFAAPDELSDFIGMSQDGMINLLTHIYRRNHYKYETSGRGFVEVDGPYLVLNTNATPDWISNRLNDTILSEGFARRVLWPYEEIEPREIAIPEVTPEMKMMWDFMVNRGRQIASVIGEVRWNQDAKDHFKNNHYKKKKATDPSTIGYYKSRHEQLLKLAMLLAVSELSLDLKPVHLDLADGYLQIVEKNLSRVFERMGQNKLNSSANRIIELLRRNGGFIKERILREILFKNIKSMEFDEIMIHLVKVGKIKMDNAGNNKLVVLRKFSGVDQPKKEEEEEEDLPINL